MSSSAVDILYHHRAGGGPIALPQFVSVGSIVGREKEGVANGCKVIDVGLLLIPLAISFTITVPEAVPSLFHNSTPLIPSLAVKKRVLPTAVRRWGLLLLPPLRISLTIFRL